MSTGLVKCISQQELDFHIPNPTTTGAIASLPFVGPRDPLGEYRRGVRRDPNAFVSLKEDKQWDS
jgi:hypothetical protein